MGLVALAKAAATSPAGKRSPGFLTGNGGRKTPTVFLLQSEWPVPDWFLARQQNRRIAEHGKDNSDYRRRRVHRIQLHPAMDHAGGNTGGKSRQADLCRQSAQPGTRSV